MAAAWEIEDLEKKRVLVSVICPVDFRVSVAWMKVFTALQLPPGSNSQFIAGLPFDAARNSAVRATLEGGFGYCAFLDADNIPERLDAFMMLVATGLPLVGGVYRQRFPPFKPAAFQDARDEKGETRMMDVPIQWGQIQPMTFVATGLMLIRRDLLEAMVQRYPEPFEWTMNPLTGKGMSEDFTFCYRAKYDLGVQPYLHAGVMAYHEMQARVGAADSRFEFGLYAGAN